MIEERRERVNNGRQRLKKVHEGSRTERVRGAKGVSGVERRVRVGVGDGVRVKGR